MLLQVRVPWGGNGGEAGAGEPGRAPDGMANPPETKVLAVTVPTDTLDPWRPVGTPGKNPIGSQKRQEISRKTSTSALLTTPKPCAERWALSPGAGRSGEQTNSPSCLWLQDEELGSYLTSLLKKGLPQAS